jgi:hypothetical protein
LPSASRLGRRIFVEPSAYRWGNLGDAIMLEVAIERLRALWPRASITIHCLEPEPLLRLDPDPGGGYFAAPTNIGERTRTVFAVVPEAGLNVGYRLTPWMSIVAGYTFLYASDVVRAPQQINRTVNYSSFNAPPGVPTGPQEPAFKFKSSSFWAQGLNVGIALGF